MPLVNVPKKIEKHRDRLGLGPGEQVLAGCTTNPKGTVARMMAREIGGAAAMIAAGSKMPKMEAPPAGSMADRFPNAQSFLVATDQRVFTTGVSLWTGSPKGMSAEWRRADLAEVDMVKGRIASPIMISFTDGSAVAVEGAAGSDPASLVAALQR